MKIRLAVAALGACALFTPTAAGATAEPLSELTHNPLYKAGKVTASCAKGLTKGTTRASTTKYLKGLVGCMNTAWAPRFKAAGLPFREVNADLGDRNSCGESREVKSTESSAMACGDSVQILLKSDWIKAADDRAILPAVTYAYSKHLGGMAGIEEAAFALPNDVMEDNEQNHRRFLQWDCFGGVFMKVVWTTQKRPASEWKALVNGVKKSEMSKLGWYGKPASRAYWLNAGFATANSASCNTWKAPKSKVT
ncbi:hypothetical protein ACIBG8_43745 [Nonomuraea sp. NPDC050556]|uniref:hypothetical protein n=1 Tax=Nonomuraea sp. NPDC050556 TaxID=3364369 RepID=UPI0037A0CFD0